MVGISKMTKRNIPIVHGTQLALLLPINKYKVSQLISGVIDADTIPAFYIDVRKPATYHLNWKINGADIRENGITGEITINVK